MASYYKGKIETDANGTIMHPQTEVAQIVDWKEALDEYMSEWIASHPANMWFQITGESDA